ncbi:MAG: FtsQ-type POTRA domain-containing protein [Candidatus Marinimicrobia bacterium]|nr:FtsQ-type POTRA domain-containing protein [Candidatus Neomarinimicrobiota bacterium]
MDSKSYVVFEADEYDRTFLALPPTIAVITNIDTDHLDIYSDIHDMKTAFLEYANSVPENGAVILCYDDPEAQNILPYIDRSCVTYGTSYYADFRIGDIHYGDQSNFSLDYQHEKIGDFEVSQVGKHHILNATAALTTAYLLHLNINDAGKGLENFAGVERRSELRYDDKHILFYDDYAHHPTEISATLEALRTRYPDRRILALFQPHLYSRTRDFASGFAEALQQADVVYLVDIYPAREKPIAGISSALITDLMKNSGFREVHLVNNMNDVPAKLVPALKTGDIVITLGAGTSGNFPTASIRSIMQNATQNRHQRLHAVLYVFIAALFFALALIYCRYQQVFTVKEIRVSGNRELSEKYITRTSGIKRGAGMFDLDLGAGVKRLIDEPYIYNVFISRQFPDLVNIHVIERNPVVRIDSPQHLRTGRLCHCPSPAAIVFHRYAARDKGRGPGPRPRAWPADISSGYPARYQFFQLYAAVRRNDPRVLPACYLGGGQGMDHPQE